MHELNLTIVTREMFRILEGTDAVLTAHLETPGLVHQSDPEQRRQLDWSIASEMRRATRSAKEKVAHLEAVLAVIGAAKSGKSTIINAIVGLDILPHRSDPMTTFPTLVRHTPGRKTPVLHFPLAAEIEALVEAIKERLAQLEEQEPLADLISDDILTAIIKRLRNGEFDRIEAVYEGRERIWTFLEGLNDVCRLAGTPLIEAPLPDPTHADGARLPVIEVEFSHIGPGVASNGRLAILDLPGPNEYGQGARLRPVVHEQLAQASAVMLVTDCQHSKTEADVELQLLVRDYLPELKNRVFVFVTKIDQLTAQDNQDQTFIKESYSRNILNNAVPPERVFPISARSAFLSNWAQRELANHGRLPEPSREKLTRDFGKPAFGTMWEMGIQHVDYVRDAAKKLWDESQIDGPLKDVIRAAVANAAFISLNSAAAKALQYNQRLDGFLRLRESIATHDVEDIQRHIHDLASDIASIQTAREAVEPAFQDLLKQFNDTVGAICHGVTEDVEVFVKDYFAHGKMKEVEELKKILGIRRASWPARVRRGIADILTSVQQTVTRSRPTIIPPANAFATEVTFRDATRLRDAQVFVRSVNEHIRKIFGVAQAAANEYVNELSGVLIADVQDAIDREMHDVLERARERLEREFNLKFEPPKAELRALIAQTLNVGALAIRNDMEPYTDYIARQGRLARVQRWAADWFADAKWGYDPVQKKREVVTVNRSQLMDSMLLRLRRFSSEMEQAVQRFLADVVRPAVDTQFDELVAYLEEFRGDLLDALASTQLEANELTALQGRIGGLLLDVEDLETDARTLVNGLEALP